MTKGKKDGTPKTKSMSKSGHNSKSSTQGHVKKSSGSTQMKTKSSAVNVTQKAVPSLIKIDLGKENQVKTESISSQDIRKNTRDLFGSDTDSDEDFVISKKEEAMKIKRKSMTEGEVGDVKAFKSSGVNKKLDFEDVKPLEPLTEEEPMDEGEPEDVEEEEEEEAVEEDDKENGGGSKRRRNSKSNGNLYIGVSNRLEWLELQKMYGFSSVSNFAPFVIQNMRIILENINFICQEFGKQQNMGMADFRWKEGFPIALDADGNELEVPKLPDAALEAAIPNRLETIMAAQVEACGAEMLGLESNYSEEDEESDGDEANTSSLLDDQTVV